MLNTLTIALGIALLLIAGSFGYSKQSPKIQPPNNQATTPAESDQRGTDQVPLTVKILPTQDAKEKADQEEHERKEKAIIDEKLAFETQRIADYTFWLSKFTFFLFCIAILQAGLFVWQLLYMRKGLKDATIAANAATASARAATDSVLLAKQTSEKQLHAYLSIESAVIDGPHQLVPEFKAKITLKNCGQTPAYEGTIWMKIYAFPQAPIPTPGRTIITFEMPPGNTIAVWPKIDSNKLLFSDEALSGYETGTVAIYIRGRADFKDAFGEKRWFIFRLRYDKRCFVAGFLSTDKIKSN